MVEVIKNFTTDTLDSAGRQLVRNDHVLYVAYYDPRQEDWRRDFTEPPEHPFDNHDFTAPTVTGTGRVAAPGPGWYETGGDKTRSENGRYFRVGKIPHYWEEELFAAHATPIDWSTVTRNSIHAITGDYFINADAFSSPPKNVFPQNYLNELDPSSTHATNSGTPGSPDAFVVFDFGDSPQEVAAFAIDAFEGDGILGADAARAAVGSYHIEAAVSGTGLDDNDYFTLASGTYDQIDPFWVDVEPTTVKYVRFKYSNRGHSSQTRLKKFWAFSKETINKGMSVFASNIKNHDFHSFNGITFFFNQQVDLSEVDYLYLNVRDQAEITSDLLHVRLGGSVKINLIQQNRLDGGRQDFQEIKGLSLDVRGVGSTTFNIEKHMFYEVGSTHAFMSLGPVEIVPPWHSEPPSDKRGDGAPFPDECIFVVDRRGLSIVDVSSRVGENEIDPKLWMRFDLGEEKMLQQLPRSVAAVEGRAYLATTRGLFVIDFPGNCMARFDERGPYRRYGIDVRNFNHYISGMISDGTPQFTRHAFTRFESSPVIPNLDIYDVAAGKDSNGTVFVALGTAEGLILYNGEPNSNAVFYQSENKLPVRKVRVSGGKVWYTQGDDTLTSLKRIDDPTSISSDGFVPNRTFHQEAFIEDSFSGPLNKSAWKKVNTDPGMVIDEGGTLTISGTHLRAGPTGIISRKFYPDRDFEASVKVSLKEFPPDARGAFRFGFARDYIDGGVLSLRSNNANSDRQGFFLSALNTDPFGGPVPQADPFDTVYGRDHRQWYMASADRSGDFSSGSTQANAMVYTKDGVFFLGVESSQFSGDELLVRVSSSTSFLSRNFSARIKGQLANGFDDLNNSAFESAGAWFGMGNRSNMFPGTGGGGDYINAAMVVFGNTSLSGVAVYSVGRYSSSASPHNFVFNESVIPIGDDENTGHDSSPYREWRIDYDNVQGRLDAYLDDQFINSILIDEFNQPPVRGLTFGLWVGNESSAGINRRVYFKDFSITYPPFNPASRFKYGLEVTNSRGEISNVLAPFTTYSGISLGSDTDPANSTLGGNVVLSDGTLHSAGITFAQDVSLGVALSGTSTIESLYIYDSNESTNGWSSSGQKNVEVWLSEDNLSWNLLGEYNLNLVERTAGITKLNFDPAVDAKFIKLRGIHGAGSYAVAGSGNWSIAEIQPLTLSGTGFNSSDGTSSAEFREWKLTYKADSREIKGYIDGQLISTGVLDTPVVEGQFVLMHDLSTVTSGTHSNFHGEFKDFSLQFNDEQFIPPGDITSFFVNSVPSGNNTAHNITVSTVSGVHVIDLETGNDPTPPVSVRKFNHEDDIFGESTNVRATFSDVDSANQDGLVFLGTGSISPSFYEQRYNKPIWVERTGDSPYGGKYSAAYHPGLDSVVQITGRNVAYFSVLDLEEGNWFQTGRVNQILNVGLTSSDIQEDAAKVAYVPFNDRYWMLYSFSRLASADIRSGDVSSHGFSTSDAESISGDSGHYHFAYILHNHTLVFGQDFLNVWDIRSNSLRFHPRNWSSSRARWNRFRSQIPWDDNTGFVGGHAVGVYCEYDRCVYFLGNTFNSYFQPWYFYRWDPEKDWLEQISAGHIKSLVWPTSDEDLATRTPIYLARSKASWLVYDPINFRVYAVGALDGDPQLYYFDIRDQKWVYPGENPPYIALRNWPSGDNSRTGTSHATYDSKRHSIVFMGSPGSQEIYEYRLERDDFYRGFDYIPVRDGLPTNSGITRQFTRNGSLLQENYTNSNDWNRDFYHSPTADEVTGKVSTFSFGPEFVTVSAGNTNTIAWLERNLYTSTQLFEADGSFDVSAMVAFPRWDTPFRSGAGDDYPDATFVLGVRDGLNQAEVDGTFGREDPNLFQEVEVRAGVSGVAGSTASFPFRAYVQYTDGQNTRDGVSGRDRRIFSAADSYESDGVNLTPSNEFRELRLKYDQHSDIIEASIDGQFAGSAVLRRKFNPAGTRFYLGMYLNGNDFLAQDRMFVANVKDIKVTRQAWEYIDRDRLVTSISGSVGSYFHEKWDSTITSGIDWVCETETYLPTYRKFDNHDYLVSLAGIGDGNKLTEIVAFLGPGQKKQIALTGDLNKRHDRETFLSPVDHVWDDIDLGKYRIVRDSDDQTVEVYLNDEETPSISVNYNDLPDYDFQHAYYGKVNYDGFERIYGPTTFSGTWTTNPDFSTFNDPGVSKNRWLNSSAYARFATVTQVQPLAQAFYQIDPDLGNVDLYTFYVATGFDSARDTPYTIVASGIVSLPSPVGDGSVVFDVEPNTDQFGNFDSKATTIKVDQRRLHDGTGTHTSPSRMQSSGWVYLGRYTNPSQVIVSADAHAGTSSTQAFVCAGAVAIDPGVRGRSTADLSVKRFRYLVGSKEFNPDPFEPSGISILDLEDNELIDFYGKQTGPALPGTAITSGDRFDE